ncbi:MAG: RNA polymerase sigma factor [Acidimicrobiia bacterium]
MNDEEVYVKHVDELMRFATSLVGPFDASDMVTDAWMKASQAARWESVDNKRAYLYRTVLNTARSHHRSTLARRVREQRSASRDRIELNEPDIDVLAALGRLSMRQRAVVVLTYWEGLTASEVAEALEVSEGSVKRHLARARSRLREILR